MLDITAFPPGRYAYVDAPRAPPDWSIRPELRRPARSTGGLAWPEAAAASVLVGAFLLLRGTALHHDAMWQLWIGRQLYHGAALYRDVLELNPPLWFWISAPLAALAEAAQVRPASVLTLFFVASAGLALALARPLLPGGTGRRGIVYAASIVALLVIPLANFGQREHFALIAAMPWAALVARRSAGGEVPVRLALAVGLLAAAGFGLKHYFLLVPLALDAWLAATGRWRARRPELLALGGALLAYLAAIIAFAPDYLTRIVPMIGAAYHGYDRPFADMLREPALGLWLLAGLGFALRRRRPARLAQAALVASAAFLLAYFVQGKGWSYQLVPAAGMLVLAVGADLAGTRARLGTGRYPAATILLLAVILAAAGAALWKGTYSNHYRPAAEAALAGLREGEAILVLSAHASSTWPMVEERGLHWPSRHFTFWMLPAIADAERSGRWSPALRRLAADTRREAALDAACASPALILVDRHETSGLMRGKGFDTLAFFRREPDFEAVLGGYEPARRGPVFDSYVRKPESRGGKPGAVNSRPGGCACRRSPGPSRGDAPRRSCPTRPW